MVGPIVAPWPWLMQPRPLLMLLLQIALLCQLGPSAGEEFLNPFEKFENRKNIFNTFSSSSTSQNGEPNQTKRSSLLPLDTALLDFGRTGFGRSLNTNFEINKPDQESDLSSQSSSPSPFNPFIVEPSPSESTARSAIQLNEPKTEDAVNTVGNRTSGLRSENPIRNGVNSNPSVDEIISGIIQLIGGNVKLNRPVSQPGQAQPSPPNNQNVPLQFPPGLLPPQLVANPGLLTQFVNRLPNRNQMMPNLPPSFIPAQNAPPNVLIGPSRVGLPLHFPPKISHRIPHPPQQQPPPPAHLNGGPNHLSSNYNLPPQSSQPNNRPLSMSTNHPTQGQNMPSPLAIPGLHQHLNKLGIPVNPAQFNRSQLANFFSSYNANPNALPPQLGDLINSMAGNVSILPTGVGFHAGNTRFVKVEESEVSRLLGIIKPSASRPNSGPTETSISSKPSESKLPDIDFNIFPGSSLQSSFGTIETTRLSSSIEETPSITTTTTLITPSLQLPDSGATVLTNHHRGNVFPSRPFANPSSDASTSVNHNGSENSPSNAIDGPTVWQPYRQPTAIRPSHSYGAGDDKGAPEIITKPEEPSVFDITVKHKLGHGQDQPSPSSTTEISAIKPTQVSSSIETIESTQVAPVITSSYSNSYEPSTARPSEKVEAEVVYGRHVISSSTPSSTTTSTTNRPAITPALNVIPNNPSNEVTGRPLVIPVQMEQVRPQLMGPGAASSANGISSISPTGPQLITQPGQGSVYIDGSQKHFKLKPVQRLPGMQVGSAVSVLPARAHEGYALPTNISSSVQISSPSTIPSSLIPTTTTTSPSASNILQQRNATRRPQFRPRPATPLVRIDTCIVGDDSTCGSAANEHCRTEAGISSCQCRPGFARSSPRTPCVPATSLAVAMRLDKLSGERINFSKQLLEPDSEHFQYLEFETAQTLQTLLTNSRLARQFLSLRVNKFYPSQGRTMVNCTVQLQRGRETNSSPTAVSALRKQLQAELARLIGSGRQADLPLSLDAAALPRVEDVNECAEAGLNDCSRNARCLNEPGGFNCVCKPGFEDRATSASVKNIRPGRVCTGCSFAYCSNRGECNIVNGERTCKCRGNYMGSRCDLDAEVLAVAFGGSLAALIIIIITFLCLYIWNQKWKSEQQKMEAMSSGSGQTFSYVNKTAVGSNFRFGMEDRMRGWNNTFEPTVLQNNASNYNYYVNPEQILASSQQHVYATPSRVQTPDHLLAAEEQQQQQMYNTRRSKSRTCTLPQSYSSMNFPPAASIYNETEFSTRETLYAPSHLILPSRPKYAMY